MARDKTVHVCSACGAVASRWSGQCGQCGAWNTLEERRQIAPAGGGGAAGPSRSRPLLLNQDAAMPLTGVDVSGQQAVSSGFSVLDEVLGPGLVRGGAALLAGEPGIGKSTLLLQVAGAVARGGGRVLYASGEEGLPQLKRRAERLACLDDRLLAMATSSAEAVWQAMDDLAATPGEELALVILDSVQTLASSLADGLPGSVAQVRAVATEGIERARRQGVCLLFVGHVTKDGQIAGPKLLEHMVDVVLSLEGERTHRHRLVRVLKNRFGPSLDVAVFSMVEQGLAPVEDPAALFLESRDAALSGTALAMALDGQRPFALEAQALVSKSWLSIPRRAALGLDVNRLHLLLAVLEKRLGLGFGDQDVHAKVGGGFKLQDPGFDLALCAALVSSYYDQPLPEQAVFFGEVDLNGRVRPVAGQEARLAQALRLGLGPVFAAPGVQGAEGLASLDALRKRLFGAVRKGGGNSR